MISSLTRPLRAFSFAAVLAATFCTSSATIQPADAVSVVGNPINWTGLKWGADDIALFGGIPTYSGTHKDLIIVRYSYFVSNYDTERLSPLWVAHVDQGDALAKGKMRTKGHDAKWDRPGSFFTDNNVKTYSEAHHRPYVVQDSYTNCNPRELPSKAGPQFDVTRGHNASNDEMKLSGNEPDGVISQHESFSLANVSPQTQGNNAPLWAALEEDCLIWASKLGRVAVFTGPVFRPNPTMAVPVNKIIDTNGKKGPLIPIPTHFFKIVIGKIDGKYAAVGFLVPHLSNLKMDDYKKYVVPIADIEKVTDLTFFTAARISPDKRLVDHRWLAMLPAR